MRWLVALALFLQGCATAYQGPGPDTSLTGDAAKTEIQKFSFDDSTHFFTRDAWFEVGPWRERLTLESLRPTIERISPEAIAQVDESRVWRRAQYGLAGGALLAFLLSAIVENPFTSEAWAVGGVLLAGGAFGINVHYDSRLRDAATTYNRDLRASFTTSF